MSVRELRERQSKLLAEARAKLDSITDDLDEGRQAEIEAEYDRIMADHDKVEARANREEQLEARTTALTAGDPRRPVGDNRTAEARGRSVTVEEAFRSYLVNGASGMEPEARAMLMAEDRAQSVGTPSAGGFTVPTTLRAELVKSLAMWGPMLDPGVTRQLVTSAGEQIFWPTMNDTANAATIIGENVALNPPTNVPGDVAFNQVGVGAFKYSSGLIQVSLELLQDSVLNIGQVISDAFAERLGRGVNAHLTNGAGTTQPFGIVTRSTMGKTVDAAAVDFDDLIDLVHSVDPAYRQSPSCRFMFNDQTLAGLRKIKDDEGRYVWQPSNAVTGEPGSILGYRYTINQAMPGVVDEAKPIVFGDFNKYVVRRVREFSVRRLDERFAEFGQVGLISFARFDGQLLDTAAVKHILVDVG